MSAIAGIALPGAEQSVNKMLEKMAYRGSHNSVVRRVDGVTLGLSWPVGQPDAERVFSAEKAVEDWISESHYARAEAKEGSIVLSRDSLGVSRCTLVTEKTASCFASESKDCSSW